MTEEEFFIKNYPDFCYGDKPLSPHWDLFQYGVEFCERESEEKITDLEETINKLREQLALRYDLEDKIKELEAQIEKMKNCKNCANYMISGKCPSFFRTGWCQNWEMTRS